MRQLMVLTVLSLAVGVVAAQDAGPVKCKADGTHLCCGTCENSVRKILEKVDGLTAVKVDRKAGDKIIFEAKSDKVAKDAFHRGMVSGGFYVQVHRQRCAMWRLPLPKVENEGR